MFLTKAQAEIAVDLHRFRVVRIGRRGGKTTLAVEEIKGKAIAKPSRICYIAPTYQQARDIAWELLKKQLLPIILIANESRLEIRVRTQQGGQSLIILRGWESIETLRGQAFDFIVIDEVAMMRGFWSNWQEVIRPTLTDTEGEVLFISTPKGYNHFYDLCNLELKDKTFKSFHCTSYDNPYISKDEIDTAKAQMTPERFIQEYLADFSKTEGLVYKEFNRDKHLYQQLPEQARDYEKIAGIDFGFTHPAVVLDIRTDGERFYVENEWVKTGRTEIQIAEYVVGCKFDAVYPDPESASAIEELKRHNINVREVVKGKDSVISGIQKVRELLINGKLKINQNNTFTISGFEMYTYDDETERGIPEKPLKVKDDEMDALRYPIMMLLGSKPSLEEQVKIVETQRQRQEENRNDAGL